MNEQEAIPGLTERGLGPLPPQIPDMPQEYWDGWKPLVAAAHAEILAVDPDYRAFQVKTKFAGLRLYIRGNAAAMEVARKYERESYAVCELCTKPGSLDDSRYWLMTLCEECKANRRPLGKEEHDALDED